MVLNSEMYSPYKSHTTYKGNVVIAPSGENIHVSTLFEGSISDKELGKRSGLWWPIIITRLFSLKTEIDFISNEIINSIRVFILLSSTLLTISILICLLKSRLISKGFSILNQV